MSENHSNLERLLAEADAAPAAAQPKRKRRGLRNTLIVLGSIVVLLGIAAGIAYAMASSAFNEVKRVSIEQDPELTRPAETKAEPGKNKPLNILLLGSDSRETTDPTATAEDLNGFRSDAIMVAQVSPDRKNLTVMSIMRDNWVEIQGHGEAKINAAVAFGGLPLAVNTVENFIGARIDHVALIDFESFKGLTDAVGGVTVNNPQAFTTKHGDFDIPAGEVTLDGEQALGFVRERYAFTDGDYQRARNQQAYLKGLMSKLLSKDTLTDASKVTGSFEALKPYLILDEGLDLGTSVSLGYEMRGIRSGDISFFTSPTLGTGTSADGQSIVVPDQAELEKVRAAFQAGTVDEYATTRKPGSELPQ
ncbi:LytR family transcriptional regulator [Leucobacter zeae]|nr:LytR family transcriptional regulator [Leucobacter zeae]